MRASVLAALSVLAVASGVSDPAVPQFTAWMEKVSTTLMRATVVVGVIVAVGTPSTVGAMPRPRNFRPACRYSKQSWPLSRNVTEWSVLLAAPPCMV